MTVSIHLFVSILQLCALFFTILVWAQDELGFISIDCGALEPSYIYEPLGLPYFSDTKYTESGENHDILSEYKSEAEDQQLWNLRSFPEGTRNCYTLEPKGGLGTRYLIRARFLYGNYDNKDQTPTFDLHIGVDFWDRVEIPDANASVHKEITHVPSSSRRIHVCLVNTGSGMPFISALELRPLDTETYISPNGTSLLLVGRSDFGSETNQLTRYKFDKYDRFWSPFKTKAWAVLNSSSLQESSYIPNSYVVPYSVMRTASTLNNLDNMGIHLDGLNTSASYFFFMHFIELLKLEKNQTREFNIFLNGAKWYGTLVPQNRSTTVLSRGGTVPGDDGQISVWFNNTGSATLPPLINALEVYRLQTNLGQETYPSDVDAVLEIKAEYVLKIQNWQGDPCVPKDYLWDGLNCSYIGFDPPRITSLDLSLRGLKGQISSHIENLTMLQYLDLSNNSLTGTVPEFLATLKELKVLNLKGNNLGGPLPQQLEQRSKFDLTLSVDDNVRGNKTSLSPTNPPSSSTRFSQMKNSFAVPIVAVFCLFVLHHVS